MSIFENRDFSSTSSSYYYYYQYILFYFYYYLLLLLMLLLSLLLLLLLQLLLILWNFILYFLLNFSCTIGSPNYFYNPLTECNRKGPFTSIEVAGYKYRGSAVQALPFRILPHIKKLSPQFSYENRPLCELPWSITKIEISRTICLEIVEPHAERRKSATDWRIRG